LLQVILYPYTTGSVWLPEYSDILRDHFKKLYEVLKEVYLFPVSGKEVNGFVKGGV